MSATQSLPGSLRTATRAVNGGYTLLELVIVVTIVAVLAAVALPSTAPSQDQKLDLAATLVADAIRHARTEAMRTGEAHGLTVSQATQMVTVKQYDLTTSPISSIATLINPVSKQPYEFNVNTVQGTDGVTISNTQDAFGYKDTGRRRSLVFDGNGTPLWVIGSGPTTHLLEDGTVELSYGNARLVVRVASLTGRVTIE
jgi:prepilin-type N-terminal cleavage/methylation domain-containing protein